MSIERLPSGKPMAEFFPEQTSVHDLVRELTRYREALEEIRNTDPVDNALDPQRPARIADAALDPERDKRRDVRRVCSACDRWARGEEWPCPDCGALDPERSFQSGDWIERNLLDPERDTAEDRIIGDQLDVPERGATHGSIGEYPDCSCVGGCGRTTTGRAYLIADGHAQDITGEWRCSECH